MRAFSTPVRDHCGVKTHLSPNAGTPMSVVRRKKILLEQQATVFRLEQELAAAQRELKALNKASYDSTENTTNI